MTSLDALRWCEANLVGVIFLKGTVRIIWSKLPTGSTEDRDFISAVLRAQRELREHEAKGADPA